MPFQYLSFCCQLWSFVWRLYLNSNTTKCSTPRPMVPKSRRMRYQTSPIHSLSWKRWLSSGLPLNFLWDFWHAPINISLPKMSWTWLTWWPSYPISSPWLLLWPKKRKWSNQNRQCRRMKKATTRPCHWPYSGWSV